LRLARRHVLRGLPVLGLLLLAACAAPSKRPTTAPAPPPSLPVPPLAAAPPAAPLPVPPASPWERLRTRFALDPCNYRPDVRRLARNYADSPFLFERSWKAALPFLLLVIDEIETRDLPGELALLPYVESGYRPLPGKRNLPGGMWQLAVGTAREMGLTVSDEVDERLDARASTRAALDLLERYERVFKDWRAADLAYNSGEFRMRKLLAGREARALSADELARLNPQAQRHLDRMFALACIVESPATFGLELPAPEAADHLATVTLEAAMDLRLAAHLAGVSRSDMAQWNAGYRNHRMPSNARELLMPAPRVASFHANAARVPLALWGDWHEERAGFSGSIARWAELHGVDTPALAAANGVGEDETLLRNTPLLLPGAVTAHRAPAAASGQRSHEHVVKAGDSLWTIARRYSLTLERLRRLNPGIDADLQPGDRIRVGVGQ